MNRLTPDIPDAPIHAADHSRPSGQITSSAWEGWWWDDLMEESAADSEIGKL